MTKLDDLRDVLPPATLDAWQAVAGVSPPDGILMGGTALAIQIRHRISRDLDIFTSEEFDPYELERALKKRGRFAATLIDAGTLNGVYEEAKVQLLWTPNQVVLAPPTRIAGLNVGSIEDLLATKVKVVGDRAELRDYFDLMQIEQRLHRSVDEGLQLYMARFAVPASHASITHIINGFGYFDDLNDDPYLNAEHGPDLMKDVVAYWKRRQPQIISNFDPGTA